LELPEKNIEEPEDSSKHIKEIEKIEKDSAPESNPDEPNKLYDFENLLFSGSSQTIEGKKYNGINNPGGNGKGGQGKAGGYSSIKTNLKELDGLGMAVTIAYETTVRCIPKEFVIDVSTPESIQEMYVNNNNFKKVFDYLTDIQGEYKLSNEYPGFDILVLNPKFDFTKTIDEQAIDRLIELKSSGVNAKKQAMTWNEWKSARDSGLKNRYYLYLVGNLRSDIPNNEPFIRIINNPFETLLNQMIKQQSVQTKFEIYTQYFKTAEEIKLGVKK
jgi:hypothetical protein